MQVYIPRRKDIILEHMNESDLEGEMKAEWLDGNSSSVAPLDLSKPAERVIIYTHGGNYFFGTRKTHRVVTWRLAKYAKARVLCKLKPRFKKINVIRVLHWIAR
jgi:acetyl esterase/lipase